MRRHIAQIPTQTRQRRIIEPVTDPRLFDEPLPPAADHATPRSVESPVLTPPITNPWDAATTAETNEAPHRVRVDTEDDGLDESIVEVHPKTARSVLDAEATEEQAAVARSSRPRMRDIAFAATAFALIAVSVIATVLSW